MRPSNKRIFPRYRMGHDFVLDVAGKKFGARLKDLSITGLGLFINALPHELNIDKLEIRLEELGLEATGKVIWQEKTLVGVSLGLMRSGPLQGDIRSIRLADLILGLRKMRRTGILRITTSCSVKEVYLKDGEVVFVTADPEDNDVNDILLFSGRITLEQCERSAERMKTTGRSQEAELVAMGHIGPKDLLWAFRRHAENIFMGLFELEEGSFFFKEGPLPANRFLSLPLEPADLIFRAAMALKEDDSRARTVFPEMHSVVYGAADRGLLQNGAILSNNEKKVLALVNGERTIREIVLLSPTGEFETLRTIFALTCVQMVELAEDHMASAEKVEAGRRKGPDSGMIYQIDKLYKEYRNLGYYGVLNIGRNASPEEIKVAYRRMAKEYHPDRYLQSGSHSLQEKLNVIFSYINEAYRSLTTSSGAQQEIRSVYESEEDRKRKMARQKYDEGRASLDRQNFEEALTLLGQAAYLDDSLPDYQYYYACALMQNKKLREAEAALRKALQLDPYNSGYSTELGYIYLRLGFPVRARSALEKALKYDPANQRAREGLKKCT